MTQGAILPHWYLKFRSEAALRADTRGNVAAVLVVLDRLKQEADLRDQLQQILREISNEVWRGWAALSLVVTSGEGQIARVTGENVARILREFGIAADYIGADGGRSSRGNFGFIRRLLGLLPADYVATPAFLDDIHAVQSDIISTLVMDQLQDNRLVIELSETRPEFVIAAILRQAASKGAAGGVAQHLVGAKLARRFRPAPIDNFSVFASDQQLNRAGDFLHGQEAFHVTVVQSPPAKLRTRLSQNRKEHLAATLLVPKSTLGAYRQMASEYHARLRSIEEYVGDNLLEMGKHDRDLTLQELRDLIATYNERVNEVERQNSGLEIDLRENVKP